jgi:predicted phosphoadenosine phosphosulfate sulfurtransferase
MPKTADGKWLASGRPKMVVNDDVLTLALERIEKVFKRFDFVSMTFSGGKDSTVCLELALMVAEAMNRLPLDVVFFDEEAIQPETIDYVARRFWDPRVKMRWYAVPIQHLNACSPTQPFWYPWAPEDEAIWVRRPPWETHGIPRVEGIPTLESRGVIHPDMGHGFDRHPHSECPAFFYPDPRISVGSFIGLRAQESLRRHQAVSRRTYDNELARQSCAPWVTYSKPIYDWLDTDVWTFPYQYDLDFNRSYDIMQAAGVSLHQQRVAPPYGAEPMQKLWTYAVCWPELWEKMINRVPGAATAGRYASSPLYGFGGVIGKDETQTWEQAIEATLQRWGEPFRSHIAARLRREIKCHFKKTKDPIPDDKPHNLSGCCWRFLYMIAVRADFKGRKSAMAKSGAGKMSNGGNGKKATPNLQKTWE